MTDYGKGEPIHTAPRDGAYVMLLLHEQAPVIAQWDSCLEHWYMSRSNTMIPERDIYAWVAIPEVDV